MGRSGYEGRNLSHPGGTDSDVREEAGSGQRFLRLIVHLFCLRSGRVFCWMCNSELIFVVVVVVSFRIFKMLFHVFWPSKFLMRR